MCISRLCAGATLWLTFVSISFPTFSQPTPPTAQTSTPTSTAKQPAPQLALQIGHDVAAEKLAVSPNGQWLASGDGVGGVKLWNLRTGDLQWTLPEASYSTDSLLFSPDGRFLAIGRGGNGASLHEVATGRRTHILTSPTATEKFLTFPVAFSPDGRLVWLARHVGLLQARDVQTGAVKRQVSFPGRFLAISPNAKVAASVDGTGVLHLWNMATGKRRRTLFTRPFVYENPSTTAATFTADGAYFATGSHDGKIELWNTTTGARLPMAKLKRHVLSRQTFGTLPTDTTSTSHQAVTSLAFSKDGQTLVVGVGDHPELQDISFSGGAMISTTNLDTGEVKVTSIEPRGDSVNAVALTPDGKTLISADDEATIRLWDAGTRRITQTLARSAEEPQEVAFAPDGQSLVTSGQSAPLRLWNLSSGSMAQTLTEPFQSASYHASPASSLAFSPDGATLAAGDLNGQIRLWQGQPRQLVATLHGSNEEVTSLAFSPDGRTLASGSEDGLVRLWQAQATTTREKPYALSHTLRVHEEEYDPVQSLAFCGNNYSIVTMGKYSSMRLWNTQTRQRIKELPFGGDDSAEGAFSPDGRLYAQQGKAGIEVWNLANGKVQSTLPVQEAWVGNILFSPDSTFLAADVSDVITLPADDPKRQPGKEQAQLRIWNLRTGKIQKTLHHWPGDAYSVAFSPDGKRLAVCHRDKTVQLWDVATGRVAVTFAMLPAQEDLQLSSNWLAFTPAGYFQASPGAEAFIRWRVGNTIRPFATFASTYRRPDLVQRALR